MSDPLDDIDLNNTKPWRDVDTRKLLLDFTKWLLDIPPGQPATPTTTAGELVDLYLEQQKKGQG